MKRTFENSKMVLLPFHDTGSLKNPDLFYQFPYEAIPSMDNILFQEKVDDSKSRVAKSIPGKRPNNSKNIVIDELPPEGLGVCVFLIGQNGIYNFETYLKSKCANATVRKDDSKYPYIYLFVESKRIKGRV